MYAVLLSALALMAQATPAARGGVVTLSCDLPTGVGVGAKPAVRTFQVAPGSFREWNNTTHEFGANLCNSYSCVKAADRSEGTIGSASVTYVVGVRKGGAEGYWRVTGASGMSPTHGSCRVVPPPAAHRP